MTSRIVYVDLNKPYLRESEAAEFACLSLTRFREIAADVGIRRFRWGGRWVYARAEIQRAMDEARWQHYGDDDLRGATTGICTGSTPTPGESASDRLERLQRSRNARRARGSRSSAKRSATVEQLDPKRRS